MRMIKLFPAPHVEMWIHVSDEMIGDLKECKGKEGGDLPCEECSWDAIDVFGQGLCGLPEVEAKVLTTELREETGQQPLPIMKNNDQRKEWLNRYREWGLWYMDEHTGARYYKYDFENGARLVVEEYESQNIKNYLSAYLHLIGGPKPESNKNTGVPKWERHERYNRYPDSESELIEFLKFIQRGEKHEN